jgi:hypothetical protein
MCKELVPRLVLLGGSGTFRRQRLSEGPEVTGGMPLKESVRPQSLTLSLLFPGHEV